MAIKLFRKGTTHNSNGIVCEIGLFDSVDGVEGWYSSPEEIDGTPVIEVDSQDSQDIFDGLSSPQIRELANSRGIEGWENKRISTLKEALLSGQDTKD